MSRRRTIPMIMILTLASACAQSPGATPRMVATAPQAAPSPPHPAASVPKASFPPDGGWQCVPYARAVSGIEIYGDAWTWWDKADGKFPRAQAPQRGAVLVFARNDKLKLGHLAVVVEIRNGREIEATDANWGSTTNTRGYIHDEKRIADVSPDNSWRQVRIWNAKANQWGSIYQTYGFVLQAHPWGPPRCALPDGSVGICPTS